MGLDKLIWAIDYPCRSMELAMKYIEGLACTDVERHAPCHGNAERVSRIRPE